MLDRVILLFAGTFCVLQVSAQITIPDAEFAAALEAIVPDAITGDQLDDQHPSVLALEDMDLQYLPIADLTGLESFTALRWLNVQYTLVTSLPALPTTLEGLFAAGTGLTVMPDVPNVTSLDLSLTQITDFSPWPPGLTTVNISDTPMQNMDPFPASLVDLIVESLGLTVLPELPVGLVFLACGGNELTALPDPLEQQLVVLSCWGNPITQLPALPSTLERLHIDGTLITALPALPELIAFSCADVPLTCLPALSDGLNEFNCDGSFIECIPGGLPINAQSYVQDFGYWEPPACTYFHPDCVLEPYIDGAVFLDANANGVNDDTGDLLPFAALRVQPGNLMSSTSLDGTFRLHLPVGSYTVEAVAGPHQIATTAPLPAELPDMYSTVSGSEHGLAVDPDVLDMRGQLTFVTDPRPGFDMPGFITFQNVGSLNASGTITLTYAPQLTFVSSVPPPDQINGNQVTWNYSAAALDASGVIDLVINTPASVPIGTDVGHFVVISTQDVDDVPVDNTAVVPQVVIGSFDPNDKMVEPTTLTPAELAAERSLRYTIRFQNTGTAEAFMVRISDTLDVRLRPETFQFLASSHPCTWFLQDGIVSFVFENINLPDSTSDEVGSHGFVTFELTPVQSLLLGESVPNVAGIYFDHNAPVITEPAMVTVEDALGVDESTAHGLAIFPNPVMDMLCVSVAEPDAMSAIRISDALGREVMQGALFRGQANLDVQALAAGVYSVRMIIGGRELVSRFVKR